MMMILAAAGGFMLGVFFYGGLWFTVRRLATAGHPALLMMGSFWLRLICAVAGFLLITRGSWRNALLCLAGFLAGRIAVTRWVKCT